MDRETIEEIKRHFGVVAEELRSEIRLVAESVVGVRTELGEFKREVAEEFKEVKAMIRLSYGQLDQRLVALESDVASLRSRLERVEARLGV